MSVRKTLLKVLVPLRRASNVNARARSVARTFRRFLEQHPIVFLDVGARGDTPSELRAIREHVDLVALEPDAEEAEAVAARISGGGGLPERRRAAVRGRR